MASGSKERAGVESRIERIAVMDGVVQAQCSGRRPSSSALSVSLGEVLSRCSRTRVWLVRAAVCRGYGSVSDGRSMVGGWRVGLSDACVGCGGGRGMD